MSRFSDSDDIVKVQITLNKRRFPETFAALEGCAGKIRSERVKKMLEEYCCGKVNDERRSEVLERREAVQGGVQKQKTITNSASTGLRAQLSSF